MELHLNIDDPEVVSYLNNKGEEGRVPRAKTALRIGVMALSSAEGVIDADAMKREGAAILAQVRQALESHATGVTTSVAGELRRYLDPTTGAFQQGAQRLVEREALVVHDLERTIQDLLGDTGMMAKSIAKQVGEGSPLLRLLDIKQKEGLFAQVELLVARNIEEQRQAVAREFSLDRADSALSHLVVAITDRNASFSRELSLDHKDSALSRLVGRVEEAQRLTVAQFSLDNADSGMARMRALIDAQFRQLAEAQQAFQTGVLEMLVRFDEKKKVGATGTQHGQAFEYALLTKLEAMAEAGGDLFDATGMTTGIIRNCKVGDAVITVGPDRVGAGRRVVYEAKEDVSYGDTKALAEIDIAVTNREADIGVFVFSRKVVPNMKPLRRVGNHVLVAWDQDDAKDDIYLEAAHTIATALIAKAAREKDSIDFDFSKVDSDIAEIEKMVERAAAIGKKCESIRSAATAIEEEVRITTDKIGGASRRLRAQVDVLKEELR
jgi:hypothetical protein